MPTAIRARTVAATQQTVWEVIADPHHHARWWPGVDRVESVSDDGFTQVLRTRRGRPIRADFRVAELTPPWIAVWEQQLEGTPFARVLSESLMQVNLEPEGEATKVTIAHRLKPRGYSRTGGFLLGRDTSKQLDRLLDGIERLY